MLLLVALFGIFVILEVRIPIFGEPIRNGLVPENVDSQISYYDLHLSILARLMGLESRT